MIDKKSKNRSSIADRVRQKAENHKGAFENTSLQIPTGVSSFTIKAGKPARIDIIPYIVGEGNPYADKDSVHYERTFYVHRAIGVDQNTYVCPAKTSKKKCPICEYRAKLMNDPDSDEKLIKDLSPKERQLFNIIDVNDRDKGIQIFNISYHLFGATLDSRIRNADEDDGYENFANLEDGLTLKLDLEEQSLGKNSFTQVSGIDFKPRKVNYDESMLEEAYCLDNLLKILSYDELKKKFLDEDDEPAAPAKKTEKKAAADEEEAPVKTKKAAKKPVVEEDDDDDDEDLPPVKTKKTAKKPVVEEDDDWDDDDEEDLPPVKTKKTSKKPVVEEDDDWDDDEDDLPPVKTKKTAKKTSKKAVVEEDEDDDDSNWDDDDEEEVPVKTKKAAKKPVVEDEDDDDEDLPPVKTKKTSKKPVVEEDDEDDDLPPVKTKKTSKKPVVEEDDDWDDDDDDWDED